MRAEILMESSKLENMLDSWGACWGESQPSKAIEKKEG